MLTPLVIPLHPTGSKWGNTELRYALRSFEKHLRNVGELYIFSERQTAPDWLINCTIDSTVKDLPLGRNKEYNIYRKLLRACEVIGQPFLYANDDHFLLTEHDANNFPNYYDGTLADLLAKVERGNPYRVTVKNTIEAIGEMANLDVHCPMIISDKQIKGANQTDKISWKKSYGYLIKTIYSNLERTQQVKDLKHQDPNTLPDLTGRPWFSVGDKGLSEPFKAMLEELYPEKSRWEK